LPQRKQAESIARLAEILHILLQRVCTRGMLQEEIGHLVMRNTFVDFQAQRQEISRCSSVPPSLRLARENVYEGELSKSAFSDTLSDFGSRHTELAKVQLSETSTHSGASRSISEASEPDAESEDPKVVPGHSSQVDASQSEESDKQDMVQMLTEPNVPESANVFGVPVPVPDPAPFIMLGDGIYTPWCQADGIYTSWCQADWNGQWSNMNQPAVTQPAFYTTPARQSLNSVAATQQPSTGFASKAIYVKFHRQYQDAVEQVRKAVADCKCVRQLNGTDIVKVQEGHQSWQVTVHLPPTLMHQEKLLLSVAKRALLRAAEQSESIYVLGFRRRPFQPVLDGFTLRLGGLWEQCVMCRHAFEKGVCYRGTCKFQHPAYESMVTVSVVTEQACML